MNKKMNNKGFSLVELIVVVLIMAIIGVALAPQVIKWVNNSRLSADNQNYDALVSAAQLALANETVYKQVKNASADTAIVITMDEDGTSITTNNTTKGSDSTSFADELSKVASGYGDYKKKDASHANYTITITKSGSVNKTSAPSDDSALDN